MTETRLRFTPIEINGCEISSSVNGEQFRFLTNVKANQRGHFDPTAIGGFTYPDTVKAYDPAGNRCPAAEVSAEPLAVGG